MLFGVRGRVWLLLAALLGGMEGPNRLCYGRYAGFQGCKFSASVCLSDEACIDDRLFGNCQKRGIPPDRFQYFLDRSTLQALEGEIYRLIKDGYSWENLYTQCVLGNILVAFRKGIQHDPQWCDKEGAYFFQAPQSKLDEQTLGQLKKYFNEYYYSEPTSSKSTTDLGELDFETSDEASTDLSKKAEEYLKIHKYIPPTDKRTAPLTDSQDYSYYADGGYESQLSDYQKLLNGFSTDDLKALKDYLQDEEGSLLSDYSDVPIEAKTTDLEPDSRGYVWGEQPISDSMLDMLGQAKQSYGNGKKNKEDSLPIEDKMTSKGDSSQSDGRNGEMSPEDAKLLGDLLEENVPVTSLTDKQIKRLSGHVDQMLKAMKNDRHSDRQKSPANSAEEKPSDLMTSSKAKDVLTEGISKGDLKVPGSKKAVTKEQLNNVLLKSSSLHNDAKITVKKANIADENVPANHVKANAQPSKVGDDAESQPTEASPYKQIHTEYANVKMGKPLADLEEAQEIVTNMEKYMKLPAGSFSRVSFDGPYVIFRVSAVNTSASQVAKEIEDNKAAFVQHLGVNIESAGIGDEAKITAAEHDATYPKYFQLTIIVCGLIAIVVISVIVIYLIKRHIRSRKKLEQLTSTGESSQVTQDYQDLCRQRMQSKASEKPEPLSAASRVGSTSESAVRSPSSRSSTSSWSEEPANSNMDISTGHIVLSYMEDHLKNKDRLDREWESLCAYEAEPSSTKIGTDAKNLRKNRYSDIVPYDHSRVVLSTTYNVSGSDFINASSITDHDPRNPAYIATQGPLPHTVADFWQMVWEQGSVVIVNLTKLTENGVAMCHRYWPEEGSELYHIYEVHLVSEHIWCDDYLVRSFYLKNLQTNETRTVTQFHFLTWPDLDVPSSIKALLDFRRKVNKSYRGRSCPIVLHCSDGVGRTGTYCVVDMVLNRMSKGAKEIDIAATLEHIRDQRMSMVKTKEQFQFALAAVAEEVHAILKALPQ